MVVHIVAIPSRTLGVLFILLGASVVFLIAQLELFSQKTIFVSLTTLLLIYLSMEVMHVRRIYPARWLLNPIVLCSLVTFVFGFGITNLLYFLPEQVISFVGLVPEVSGSMNKLMLLVLGGAFAMWIGYWSSISAALSRWLAENKVLDRLLKLDFEPRMGILPLLVTLSLIGRIIDIKLGGYGVSAEYDRLIELSSYRQYLTIAEGLGKLALVIVALQYFSSTQSFKIKIWLYSLLTYEVAFGFLSGFKSQAVAPFVIICACQYFQNGRIPWRWIVLVPIAVIAAYLVIEPFRGVRTEDTTFSATSAASIAGTMIDAVSAEQRESTIDRPSTALRIMARLNLSYIGALGIEFFDTHPLPDNSPAFLEDIFLSPLYAFVPRFAWDSKEVSRHGFWYYKEVMGIDRGETSIAMSPFTYLYFAGGVIAVGIGFFFVGIFQRLLTSIFFKPGSAGATLVFLMILPTFINIDSIFYSFIVELLRSVPAIICLQYLVYRR